MSYVGKEITEWDNYSELTKRAHIHVLAHYVFKKKKKTLDKLSILIPYFLEILSAGKMLKMCNLEVEHCMTCLKVFKEFVMSINSNKVCLEFYASIRG